MRVRTEAWDEVRPSRHFLTEFRDIVRQGKGGGRQTARGEKGHSLEERRGDTVSVKCQKKDVKQKFIDEIMSVFRCSKGPGRRVDDCR